MIDQQSPMMEVRELCTYFTSCYVKFNSPGMSVDYLSFDVC